MEQKLRNKYGLKSYILCKFIECNLCHRVKSGENCIQLPCDHVVCQSHLNYLNKITNIKLQFFCAFCSSFHQIPEGGFPIYSFYDLYSDKYKKNQDLRKEFFSVGDKFLKLESNLSEFYTLLLEPKNEIKKKFNEYRKKINEKEEELPKKFLISKKI